MQPPLFLDTETIGLTKQDEILQLSIVDDHSKVLFNRYLKPVKKTSWPKAEKKHGISPKDVQHCLTYQEVEPEVHQIIKGRNLVVYNATYDSQYVDFRKAKSVACCMEAFAEYIGEWDGKRESWKWHSLIVAAEHVLYEYKNPHNAEDDCHALKAVWNYLDNDQLRASIDSKRENMAYPYFI